MPTFLKNISTTEIIVLVSILVLLFGAKTFISMSRTAGQSYKEIKKIKKNFTEAIEDDAPNKSKEGVTK